VWLSNLLLPNFWPLIYQNFGYYEKIGHRTPKF
jgi:hypothetical protein